MSMLLAELILSLPEIHDHHAPGTEFYSFLKKFVRKEIEGVFSEPDQKAHEFEPFGQLMFPYKKMGAVDSTNLFDLDELILFSFYWGNRKRYRRVADIGANLGLHSILLSKCGYEVRSFEPDPTHFGILQNNLKLNNCTNVQPMNVAVSSCNGKKEFVRVMGNTTGSHLSGSKANPYGELQRFEVEVSSIAGIMEWADLIKLDAEGHEKEILLATRKADWLKTDAFVEVENTQNAEALFTFFTDLNINLFSQKKNWGKVTKAKEMPAGYKEGSLFISSKAQVPWTNAAEAALP